MTENLETETHDDSSSSDAVRPEKTNTVKEQNIDKHIRNDCEYITNPVRYGHPSYLEVLFLMQDESTQMHQLLTGLLCGGICKEFYFPLHFFEGWVAGSSHDSGKEKQRDLFEKPGVFTDSEKTLSRQHVRDTSNLLQKYPYLSWWLSGHHLAGQKDPYPKYKETVTHMKSLHRALSVADKASASIEMRPGLTLDQVAKRHSFIGLMDNIDRLMEWFEPEQSILIPKQIAYVKFLLHQKIVFEPFQGRRIRVEDDFADLLIRDGKLNSDRSRLELDFLSSPGYGIEMVKLLIHLTKRGGSIWKIYYEPLDDPQQVLDKVRGKM